MQINLDDNEVKFIQQLLYRAKRKKQLKKEVFDLINHIEFVFLQAIYNK